MLSRNVILFANVSAFALAIVTRADARQTAPTAEYCSVAAPHSIIDMSQPTIDYRDPANLSFLHGLRRKGVKTILRYYSYFDDNGRTKTMYKQERDAITKSNISVAVVFQHCNSSTVKFEDDTVGYADATRALDLAKENAQPSGSPIYFGVDFDPKEGRYTEALNIETNIANVERYFTQIAEKFTGSGYRVGVYGSGIICDVLQKGNIAELCWLSQSSRFLRTADRIRSKSYDLRQFYVYPLARCNGREVDFNNTREPNHQFGQFVDYAAGPSIAASREPSDQECPNRLGH
jgi:hypothetical protein